MQPSPWHLSVYFLILWIWLLKVSTISGINSIFLHLMYIGMHFKDWLNKCPINTLYLLLSFSCTIQWASQVVLVVKNSPAKAGDIRDMGLIPGSGRSPGGGHGNPPQYSCLENPMDRGAWWATVHRVTESDMTERLSTHARYSVGSHQPITSYVIVYILIFIIFTSRL